MSLELPGPHQCLSISRTVTDIVFRGLRAQCAAGGGNLSLQELDSFHSKIIESFSSGFDLFELKHHHCMAASLGKATMPFARSKILSTLLRVSFTVTSQVKPMHFARTKHRPVAPCQIVRRSVQRRRFTSSLTTGKC
jgi:hypothetical protein